MTRSVEDIEKRVFYLEKDLRKYLSERNLREHSNDVFDFVHDKSKKEGFSLKGPRFHVEYLLNVEITYNALLNFCRKTVNAGELPSD